MQLIFRHSRDKHNNENGTNEPSFLHRELGTMPLSYNPHVKANSKYSEC